MGQLIILVDTRRNGITYRGCPKFLHLSDPASGYFGDIQWPLGIAPWSAECRKSHSWREWTIDCAAGPAHTHSWRHRDPPSTRSDYLKRKFSRHAGYYERRQHTDLKPDLFIERCNFLGSGQSGGLLTLWLQRHMAIDLRVGREMAMMSYARSGRRLSMSHDSFDLV